MVDLDDDTWSRLVTISPPEATEDQRQAAADRYQASSDVNRAAADLWEDAAMAIPVAADPAPGSGGEVASISQDGISVTYVAGTATAGSRAARYASYMARAQALRASAKPVSATLNGRWWKPRFAGDTPLWWDGDGDGPIIPVVP